LGQMFCHLEFNHPLKWLNWKRHLIVCNMHLGFQCFFFLFYFILLLIDYFSHHQFKETKVLRTSFIYHLAVNWNMLKQMWLLNCYHDHPIIANVMWYMACDKMLTILYLIPIYKLVTCPFLF
jgi:hypothetical protein